tara:strand:+ start:408 stop:1556 length:1149 start_codon:yes stop_codon:yes gene_type:complete
MTIQVFKAKDIKTAQGLVSEEFGDDAIILSTKKNNGLVEIEASNSDEVIKKFPTKNTRNKNFSKIFYKKLAEDTHDLKESRAFQEEKNNTSEKRLHSDDINKKLNSLQNQISRFRKEISSMILTDDTSLCDNLSKSTTVKLKQKNFSSEVINKLNYSFQGKNIEEGKISFFRELSRKLVSHDFDRILNTKNIFVFGNSGSGKSTLVAKLASFISDERKEKKINFIDVTNSSTNHSEMLRGYSRVLGFKIMDFKNFDTRKLYDHEDNTINIFDFSGDLGLSVRKIKEIQDTGSELNFCSILALQSGSNSAMINNIWSKVKEIKPIVALTKLDECWTGAEELSALEHNKARIGIVTGTKVIIDSILKADENSLTKYMKENFQSD